ncbi:MAG TPA: copper-binding protein [Pseudoduganella sp.]
MKAINTTLQAAILAAAFMAGAPAMASHGDHSDHGQQASTMADTADGEIKKVDKPSGKLTIKHGELKNMGMGAMTMVFRVKDAAMLDKVKAGDKVRFTVENANGAMTVTAIEVAK